MCSRSANVSKQPSPAFSTSSSGSGSKKPPVVILSGDSQRRKEPQAVVNGVEDDVSGAISFGFDINPALLAATGPAAADNFSTAAADGDENSSGDEEGSDTTVSCSGAESPVQQSINQSGRLRNYDPTKPINIRMIRIGNQHRITDTCLRMLK